MSLKPLTLRGRCLLTAGLTAALAGLIMSQRDLLRVGVVLIAAPLIAVATTSRNRFRLSCERLLDPPRVAAESRSTVTIRLENVSRLPTGLLLVEDTIPYVLGGRPRVLVNRLMPRRPVNVGYDVTSHARGRYTVGPLTVRLLDPFGLCELHRSFTATDVLVVTPTVVPLPAVRLTGEWAGAGESSARSVATAGEDDAATREYRQGDDLRRIHWRSTARRGELTVRREEQPWQSRAAVLLDSRTMAHVGEGSASSFEWGVSAAASIALHLARSGFSLRLVTDSGDEVSGGGLSGASFDAAVLDSLAVLRSSGNRSLRLGVSALRQHGGEGLLIAILGAITPADAEQLARLRGSSRSVGLALLADTESWDAPAMPAAGSQEQPRSATSEAAGRSLLVEAGWRVVDVRRHRPLSDIWLDAGMSVAATTSRTVVATTGAA